MSNAAVYRQTGTAGTKQGLSDAVYRHTTALGVKQELLKEIDHWKRSSNTCMADMTHKLGLLKEAKMSAKREINFARACLEEQLRDLEERAEVQIQNLVRTEERTVREFMANMTNKQKRLDTAEINLMEDLVGHKLNKAINSGRQNLLSVREELIRIHKHDIPITIRFSLSRHLDSILTGTGSFGETILRGQTGKLIKRTEIFIAPKSNYSKYKMIMGQRKMEEVDSSRYLTMNGASSKGDFVGGGHEMNGELDDEFETVFDMNMQDENCVKPFTETVVSLSRNPDQFSNGQFIRYPAASRTPRKTFPDRGQSNRRRPQSARYADINKEVATQTRALQSAREDSRADGAGLHKPSETRQARQDIKYLNDVKQSYTPHEEQGPEAKRNPMMRVTKTKHSVRYLDYDIVKEITRLKDHATQHPDTQSTSSSNGDTSDKRSVATSMETNRSDKKVGFLSATPGLSAIKYLPLRDRSPDSKKNQSFFEYKARFHTRKHPNETDLCRLSGIVALDNGKIVVTDINHMKVMLFGEEYTYRFALDCPSPCGVCLVEPNIIAVTLFHNRKILLIKVFSIHMERYKEFSLACKDNLYAIAHRNERFYVLCSAGDIHIVGDDGKQERELHTEMRDGKARHVEVDENGSRILISGDDRVVCFNSDTGEKVWQYLGNSKTKRFTPSGLCLYNGRLFVADWRSSHVIELSMEGSHVRDVIIDNLESPQAMSVQKYMNRIYLTQSNMFKQEARSRTVKVFVVK